MAGEEALVESMLPFRTSPPVMGHYSSPSSTYSGTQSHYLQGLQLGKGSELTGGVVGRGSWPVFIQGARSQNEDQHEWGLRGSTLLGGQGTENSDALLLTALGDPYRAMGWRYHFLYAWGRGRLRAIKALAGTRGT